MPWHEACVMASCNHAVQAIAALVAPAGSVPPAALTVNFTGLLERHLERAGPRRAPLGLPRAAPAEQGADGASSIPAAPGLRRCRRSAAGRASSELTLRRRPPWPASLAPGTRGWRATPTAALVRPPMALPRRAPRRNRGSGVGAIAQRRACPL